MTTQELIRKHRPAFQLTVRNPFAQAVHDGKLKPELFDRWLVQAFYLVEGHFAPVSRLLAVAPHRDRPTLLRGLELLQGEVDWYHELIAKRRLDASVPVHPVILKMKSQMVALAFEPYVVGIVAFWAQGATYAGAWQTRRTPAGPYRDFVERWGHSRAGAFVRQVGRAADRALAVATPRETATAEEAFVRILDDKLAYWSILLG
jgi:formylaminopyrimidine deformylase / aminopyrimidine aminohydrolase